MSELPPLAGYPLLLGPCACGAGQVELISTSGWQKLALSGVPEPGQLVKSY